MIDTSMRAWLDTIFLAFLAIVVGIIVGYASLAFLWAIHWLYELLLGVSGANLYARLAETSRLYLFFLPVIGAVLVSLIVKFGMSEQCNRGPEDAIYTARLGKGYLSIRDGLVSALASIVSISSGASVGRYGPVVHLGGTLGAWVAQQLKLSQDRRKTLLACGVAGAISASFSAPLAGVVFAHEVVLGRFGSRSVMPIVIASVVATTIAKMHAASGILFMLPELYVMHTWEYFLFAFVGTIGGGLAVIFMSMLVRSNQLAQRLPVSIVVRALLGGLLLGAIVIVFPQTFGLGEQAIRDALMLELTAGYMLALVIAKLLATSVSFAAGFAGGVFGPALYLGAMMGMVIGLGVHGFTDAASSPAVYGIAGMGAVISRVIGAPIATILIIFELTGSYSLTTAVMVAVVVGGTVTRDFFNQSYFYHQLRERGIEPDESEARQSLQQMPVHTLMNKVPVVLTADMSLLTARHALIKQNIDVAYVVNEQQQLLGQINVLNLLELSDEHLQAQSVGKFLSEPIVVLEENMNVLEIFPKLKNFVGVNIPVVADDASKQLVGIIYTSKLADIYLQALEKAR